MLRKKVMNSSLFTLRSSLNHRSVLSVDGGSKGDNHLFHTSIDGCKRILQLRNHAACHGTICFISLKIGMGNHWNHAVVILRITEHAFLFKTIYQCHIVVRRQSLGSLAGYGVGIGVEILPLPSWVNGAITGVMPSLIRVWSILPLARSTSPTNPKSIPSFNGRL